LHQAVKRLQTGAQVEMLDTEALARRDLSRFHTILLGIRAYAAREDVKVYNARLLYTALWPGTVSCLSRCPGRCVCLRTW